MDDVTTPFAEQQQRRSRYDALREYADDLEQAVAMYLRALTHNDPLKVELRLAQLREARSNYVVFRKTKGAGGFCKT